MMEKRQTNGSKDKPNDSTSAGGCGTFGYSVAGPNASTGSSASGSGASYSPHHERSSFDKEVKEAAHEVKETAMHKTEQLKGEVQQRAQTMFSGQKSRAAEGLGNLAHAFRQTGQQLRDNDQEAVAQYTDRIADRVEQLSGYVQDKNMDDLMRDAQDMARHQPGMFMAGAFALGFLVSRFLKSSSRRAITFKDFTAETRQRHASSGSYGAYGSYESYKRYGAGQGSGGYHSGQGNVSPSGTDAEEEGGHRYDVPQRAASHETMSGSGEKSTSGKVSGASCGTSRTV